MVFVTGICPGEREYQNVSFAHINSFIDGRKRRLSEGETDMITLLVGLLGSALYAWWSHRKGTSTRA
jgi:hypothetical protein